MMVIYVSGRWEAASPLPALEECSVPIAGNAGDLLLWHQYLSHGSSANEGRLPRLARTRLSSSTLFALNFAAQDEVRN